MSVYHLQGKRTGRPRGSKSTPPAIRGLIWAGQNLGKDVEPPTDAARHWQRVGHERPDQLIAALAALDAAKKRHAEQVAGREPSSNTYLADTHWSGSEGAKNREISFHFRADGAVSRTDSNDTYRGTWTLQDGQLNIVLNGVTYHATSHDNTITGTCVFECGETWNFSVTRQTQ